MSYVLKKWLMPACGAAFSAVPGGAVFGAGLYRPRRCHGCGHDRGAVAWCNSRSHGPVNSSKPTEPEARLTSSI